LHGYFITPAAVSLTCKANRRSQKPIRNNKQTNYDINESARLCARIHRKIRWQQMPGGTYFSIKNISTQTRITTHKCDIIYDNDLKNKQWLPKSIGSQVF